METDPTQPGFDGKHPTMAELRNPASHPEISHHVESCSMCRSILAGDHSAPIPLDLPKGLVSEVAFRWPADPMARGGMAQIFAGEDRRLGRPVILKAPREGEELPAGMAEMFQRRVTAEARILAKLQHPAIVTIYELGKASVGWPFCVLQRVEGTSLRDRLDALADEERDGRPRTRERLELLSNLVSIAEALAYAHERHVVHRDCTPNNILLGKRGEATLIDWGIARDLDAPGDADAMMREGDDDSPSASGRMVTISAGTPPYLPLEQTQGRAADPSFDVYSFGVTLYEVVAGRTPFEWIVATTPSGRAKQLDAFLGWLKSDDEPPPAMARDPELSGIVARSIAKDRARRFTADELVRALKQYLTGELVFSHRYSRTGRLARWMGRASRRDGDAAVRRRVGGRRRAGVGPDLAPASGAAARAEADAAQARELATQKESDAEKAAREADAAEKRAAAAKSESQEDRALRKAAEDKRAAAERLRTDPQRAALAAKGDAEESRKAKVVADAARDTAEKAEADAQHDRDQALADKQAADVQRAAARAGEQRASQEREAATAAKATAEATEQKAEADRDAGAHRAGERREGARRRRRAARAGVEKERDEERKQLVVLEAKLKELETKPSAPPPDPAPAPAP